MSRNAIVRNVWLLIFKLRNNFKNKQNKHQTPKLINEFYYFLYYLYKWEINA